jgi:hypothetical protein
MKCFGNFRYFTSQDTWLHFLLATIATSVTYFFIHLVSGKIISICILREVSWSNQSYHYIMDVVNLNKYTFRMCILTRYFQLHINVHIYSFSSSSYVYRTSYLKITIVCTRIRNQNKSVTDRCFSWCWRNPVLLLCGMLLAGT